jgi:hypothetical protein
MSNAIDGRLQSRRERLANLLDINLDEREWQNQPPEFPNDPNLAPGERYIRWRKTPPTEGRQVYRIDLALEELGDALRECWGVLRDVNRAGSAAQVFRTLEAVARAPAKYTHVDSLRELGPRTISLIEDNYPGNWMALEENAIDTEHLREAARAARNSLPKPTRGRPKWAEDLASRKLAQRRAGIFSAYTETAPTRRVPPELGAPEYGPFREFVEEIVAIMPVRLRRTSKGGVKNVDHLVRMGVEHLKPPKLRV